jgi:enterobactin synthetase component F
LPPYMVPRSVAIIDVFPLNSNGKIDRSKLPIIELASNDKKGGGGGEGGGGGGGGGGGDLLVGDAPMNGEEFEVRDLYAEILRMSPSSLSTTASFFALGGDSLSALLLLRQLREKYESICGRFVRQFFHS